MNFFFGKTTHMFHVEILSLASLRNARLWSHGWQVVAGLKPELEANGTWAVEREILGSTGDRERMRK